MHGRCIFTRNRSHDNSKFGSCGGDRSVFLWDVTTGQTIRRFAGHMGKVNTVDFNAESTVLVSGAFPIWSSPPSATVRTFW
jgi:mitogen-activated protein kinase organizer 1